MARRYGSRVSTIKNRWRWPIFRLGTIVLGTFVLSALVFYLKFLPFYTERLGRPDRVCNGPAKEIKALVLELLRSDPLNFSVESSGEGEIETTFREVPGGYHGIWMWKKRYQAQVKIHITIKQAWDASDKTELFLIAAARERPNIHYPWEGVQSSQEAESTLAWFRDTLDARIPQCAQ